MESRATPATLPAARDTAIRAGSKSFSLASRLFDPTTRDLVWDLYAWCRHCDDTVDGQELGHGHAPVADVEARLETLRTGTEAAFAGRANPADAFGALGRVVAATRLPRRLADDHLAGFAMDTRGRTYDSADDVLEYCYHVAGVVGLMMAWVMGVRDRAVLCRASDLGLAFQLSNIARDVADDARAGRLYLPAAWLREARVALAPGRTVDAEVAAQLVPVVARLLDLAEPYYDSAWYGIAHLPPRSAWAVATARLVYRDIGRQVRQRGANAWTSRTVVGSGAKAARLVQAAPHAAWLRRVVRHRVAPPRAGLYTPSAVDVLG